MSSWSWHTKDVKISLPLLGKVLAIQKSLGVALPAKRPRSFLNTYGTFLANVIVVQSKSLVFIMLKLIYIVTNKNRKHPTRTNNYSTRQPTKSTIPRFYHISACWIILIRCLSLNWLCSIISLHLIFFYKLKIR